MAHEYVFRGEHKPFKEDPNEARAREAAKREAEQLVNQPHPSDSDLSRDAEIEARVGDYQVGGLDAFGADSEAQLPNAHLHTQRETKQDHSL